MSITGVAVFGLALLIAGWLLGIWILWVLGAVALVVAVVMLLFGLVGHPVGGRRY